MSKSKIESSHRRGEDDGSRCGKPQNWHRGIEDHDVRLKFLDLLGSDLP
jgi:hypothetical protein